MTFLRALALAAIITLVAWAVSRVDWSRPCPAGFTRIELDCVPE